MYECLSWSVKYQKVDSVICIVVTSVYKYNDGLTLLYTASQKIV